MRLEDRWLRKTDALFQSLPGVVRALLIIFGLLGVVVVMIPDLQVGLPIWLRVILVAPILLMLFLEVVPFVVIRWARAISWPIRKIAIFMRKAH